MSNIDTRFLLAVEQIVLKTGEFIRREAGKVTSIKSTDKAFHDPVSYVDKTAELMLVEGLSKLLPEAGYIAEEGTGSKNGDGYNWVVDPLDGTLNFLHNLPIYSISVALAYKTELLLGVVYEINNNELFSALKGNGATCNGKPISVSQTTDMHNSIWATGFPFRDYNRIDAYIKLLKEIMFNTKGIRRLGSAAVDLCYTAAGRFDGYFEYGLNPYDIAGGIVVVRESGGFISDFQGDKNNWSGVDIIASNIVLYPEIITFVRKHF